MNLFCSLQNIIELILHYFVYENLLLNRLDAIHQVPAHNRLKPTPVFGSCPRVLVTYSTGQISPRLDGQFPASVLVRNPTG